MRANPSAPWWCTEAGSLPTIYVDADACPVKPEAARVAERHGLVIVYVSNGGLRPSRDPMVRHVVVPGTADAADDWIVENAVAGDIAITADVPLAARLVEMDVHVLGPTGRPFTPETIGMAVAMRNLKQDLRESGEIKGYNPGFTARDRSDFLQALDRTVRRALKENRD
ncbi:MAG: YaiI/YqxD family protein [Nitratireductor sp.]